MFLFGCFQKLRQSDYFLMSAFYRIPELCSLIAFSLVLSILCQNLLLLSDQLRG